MRTKTIGEILKEERSSRRVDLEFLSKKSKISLDYLQALENNDFAKLPSAVYIKSFIKNYAKIFGFDHKPLIAILRRDYQEDIKGRLIPRHKNVAPRRSSSFRQADLFFFVVLTIFISIISFIAFKWYQLNKAPSLEINSPTDMEEVSAQVMIVGQTDQDAKVEVNAQAISINSDGSFETEVLIPREGLNSITIKASNDRGKYKIVQKSVRVKF